MLLTKDERVSDMRKYEPDVRLSCGRALLGHPHVSSARDTPTSAQPQSAEQAFL